MTPFHVGMRVVCVDDFINTRSKGEIAPIKGGVYTIRNIVETPSGFSFRLKEIVNVPHHYSDIGFSECTFKQHRFRPAHENRMDELRTLLAPVPSKELVQV